MSDTYSNVDASSDVEGAIAWQERIDLWPPIAAYKAVMDDRIANQHPVLDIGAGPGTDAARTGAVGLDASIAMAKRARSRQVPIMVGDAQQLPIGTETLGAVRADRVLQHLERPEAALEEALRILRPGGLAVFADPDQQTLSISVPGVPDRITSTVRRLRRDIGYRNGRIAAETAGLLAAIGLTQVRVEASALVLTEPELAFGLPGWVERWKSEGGFTDSDDVLWRRQLARTANAGFVYSVTYLVTSAIKPESRGISST